MTAQSSDKHDERVSRAKPGDEIRPSSYRKKPVVIEALRWCGTNLKEVIDFTGLHPSADKWTWAEYEAVVAKDGFKIFTLEGAHMVSVGDYIIKGVKGEFYACKPDIFALTYERELSARPSTLPPTRGAYAWIKQACNVLRPVRRLFEGREAALRNQGALGAADSIKTLIDGSEELLSGVPVSPEVEAQIDAAAGITPRSHARRMTRQEAVTLFCEVANRFNVEGVNLTEPLRRAITAFSDECAARVSARPATNLPVELMDERFTGKYIENFVDRWTEGKAARDQEAFTEADIQRLLDFAVDLNAGLTGEDFGEFVARVLEQARPK